MSQQIKACSTHVLHVIITLQHKVISVISVLNAIKFYVKVVRIVSLGMVLLCEYLFIIIILVNIISLLLKNIKISIIYTLLSLSIATQYQGDTIFFRDCLSLDVKDMNR